MEESHKKSGAKRQLNIRISETAHDRLEAWAFLDRERSASSLLTDIVERLTEIEAREDPSIDGLMETIREVRARRHYEANEGAYQDEAYREATEAGKAIVGWSVQD